MKNRRQKKNTIGRLEPSEEGEESTRGGHQELEEKIV